MILPACQVYDAGEFTWAPARRSWWCHTCSLTLSTCTPAKRAGSSDVACIHGLIRVHTLFHVVHNWQASPKIVAPSKRNCQIARAPKRTRGAHTECVQLNESHDPAGAFAALPSSFVPPYSRQNPGPGRVDHLHHLTPMTSSDSAHNPGSQRSDHNDQATPSSNR